MTGPEHPPREPAATDTGPPRKSAGRRALRIALVAFAIVVVAVAALIGYGLSERGFKTIVARIVGQSGGKITVENPSGSIGGTMRFGRIVWHDGDTTVTADDVVIDWNPGALLSKRLSIRGLGARRVDIELKPSTTTTTPPTNLGLPLSVDIERLAVAELQWRSGPNANRLSGIEFGYAGDAESHRFRDLRLVSDFGKLGGALDVGARAPLTVAGTATLDGDGPLAGASGTFSLSGNAATIEINGKGAYHDAAFALHATATPFSTAPFSGAIADLDNVDLQTFDASLPKTLARLHVELKPHGSAFEGTASLANAQPGPIDTNQLPVSRVSSNFVLDGKTVTLTDIDATTAGGGGARGEARIVLDAPRSARLALDVRDLDLSRIHTKLVPTHLSGAVRGQGDDARQTLEGDIRDRDIGLAFAAAIADRRLDLSRFKATTAGGSLSGSAQLDLHDSFAFTVDAAMQRLDPSRFADVPKASLNGHIKAKGTLQPTWRVETDAVVAPGSMVAGLATAGAVKGTVSPDAIRNALVDLRIASATLHAKGSAGTAGDSLTYDIDVPRVEQLAAIVPASVPRPLAGAVRATGSLALTGKTIGGTVDLKGRSLRVGDYAAAALQARASVAPGPIGARASLADRALSFDVSGTGVKAAGRVMQSIRASASGTLAHHRATLAAVAKDIDLAIAVDGSLANADTPARAQWTGRVLSFENRGTVPVHLRSPATLAARAGYVRLADAHLDAADGSADVLEFTWNQGRITTRGSFTGIAIARAAKLAGIDLPLESTLVAGGDWSIAATPRLNGTFAIHRERGDILANLGTDDTISPHGLGVSTLEVTGQFRDDALDARANFVSERAGTAQATVAIGSTGASDGKIDPSASLSLALRADLASLSVFQPWLGTRVALGGRAHLDVAAAGTVGNPRWSGSVNGDEIRIDAPQYGVNATNGRVRAHLTTAGVVLDEVYFASGDGSFTASGLVALPGAASAGATRVTWKADRFRAANRPDLRLVLNGSGTVALENKRIALTGNVEVVDGHVEFDSAPSGQLASDIVIKGRTPASRRASAGGAVPLTLNLDVDFGRSFTFEGQGLATGLAGKLRITTSTAGTLLGRGTIRTVNGTFVAFGQKLTIDRGRVIFDGPLDNPALDVVALRKNLPVEAGVEVTGTVKVPQVRVTSNPPVPENEALAWLITGQGLSNSSRVDYAALSAASAALLGRGGKPITAQIAQSIGVDDISLKSSGSGTGLDSQVVVFGKRISDRLSLGYEQGLSLATSAVRLEYALSRQVTLRAEAGQVSGVGIVYRRSFE